MALVAVAGITCAMVLLSLGEESELPRPVTTVKPRTVNAGAIDVKLTPAPSPNPVRAKRSPIDWRPSLAVGEPFAGRLIRGVQLPPQGRDWFTWDPIKRRSPNRGWRRWGTDELLRVVLRVGREFRAANPGAPRLTIGDISRPRGGDFGPQFGYIGHASHQNGLDIDIYYPRTDRVERAPTSVAQIDMPLAQDLVDRFVAEGAEFVFVGPSTPLTGPSGVVQALAHHDNHIHVRLPNPVR